MGYLVITIDPSGKDFKPEYYRYLTESLAEFDEYGHDCHAMSCTWVVQTERSVNDLVQFIEDRRLIMPTDGFMVASINGEWSGRACRMQNDCFEN